MPNVSTSRQMDSTLYSIKTNHHGNQTHSRQRSPSPATTTRTTPFSDASTTASAQDKTSLRQQQQLLLQQHLQEQQNQQLQQQHHNHLKPQISLVTSCLLVTLLLLVASGISPAEGFPRERRHFFTTCWGWGAGCSHSGGSSSSRTSLGRSAAQVAKTPRRTSQDRRNNFEQRFRNRHSGRLASPFSSSNWGAGTMGKRDFQNDDDNNNLINDNNGARGDIMDNYPINYDVTRHPTDGDFTNGHFFLERLGRSLALQELLAITRKTSQ